VMIDCERGAQGQVWLALPAPLKSLRVKGRELEYEAVSAKVYSIYLEVEGPAILEIQQS